MSDKTFISWSQYELYIAKIADWITMCCEEEVGAIYGLPRGGLPIAVSLSHKLDLPILMNYYDRKLATRKKILVVDDIADTGHTLKSFETPHNVICTIHYHQDSITKPDFFCSEKGDDWIVSPWETEDSETVQDYLKS